MIKLIVVDDEERICNYLTEFFKKRGYQTFGFTSSKEALSAVEKERPNIILLDINMPEMDGLELLKKIREVDKESKIIMVTVVNDKAIEQEAIEFGADAFVKKPFYSDYLEDVVLGKIEELFPLKSQKKKRGKK